MQAVHRENNQFKQYNLQWLRTKILPGRSASSRRMQRGEIGALEYGPIIFSEKNGRMEYEAYCQSPFSRYQ